jgi:hypothetical protein
MRRGILTLIILTSLAGGLTPSIALALDPQVMTGLQKLLSDANDERGKLDTTLVDSLKDMQATQVNDSKTYLLETTLLNHEAKIGVIREKLSENHMIIEFLNEFISAMEPAKDARAESPKILQEMAHKQILNGVESSQESMIWSYEIKLGIAIRDIMEPSEKFADFVKMYMAKYPLGKPVSLAELPKERKYINGSISGTSTIKISNPTEE